MAFIGDRLPGSPGGQAFLREALIACPSDRRRDRHGPPA
jgi:hypothetical protein